jgi:hypothetical protein
MGRGRARKGIFVVCKVVGIGVFLICNFSRDSWVDGIGVKYGFHFKAPTPHRRSPFG